MSVEGLKNRRLSLDQSSPSKHFAKGLRPGRKTRLVTPKLLWKVENSFDEQARIKSPFDLAFLPNHHLVVSEIGARRLQIFDNNGKSVKVIAEEELSPRCIAVDKQGDHGNILATDAQDKTVWVFSMEGEFIRRWPVEMFKEPCGIAITHSGKYIITDTAPDVPKIHVCEPSGDIICSFGNSSTNPGDDLHLKCPNYVCVDQYDRLIVSDWSSHCVKIFSVDGQLLSEFGADSGLRAPNGIVADYLDNILVVDNGNHRVSLYSASGNLMQPLLGREDGLYWPEGLAVSDGGVMAVTENALESDGILAYQV